ncbi:uncharacterized protein DS421_17g593550 [Arachis hypogaea]|nr:uncharacterized protein DS421_17g593550 [Arachis hypogaea]
MLKAEEAATAAEQADDEACEKAPQNAQVDNQVGNEVSAQQGTVVEGAAAAQGILLFKELLLKVLLSCPSER